MEIDQRRVAAEMEEPHPETGTRLQLPSTLPSRLPSRLRVKGWGTRKTGRDPSLTLFAQDDNCWRSGCSALRAELVGQVDRADRDHVEISGLGLIRFPGAAVAEFIGTINESGSEAAAARGL